MVMGLSFIFQTVMNNFAGGPADDDGETGAAAAGYRGQKDYSYEEAVRKQEQEGGARRYYADVGEGLDDDSARVTDENGNPVARSAEGYKRDFTHVNVQYCIS